MPELLVCTQTVQENSLNDTVHQSKRLVMLPPDSTEDTQIITKEHLNTLANPAGSLHTHTHTHTHTSQCLNVLHCHFEYRQLVQFARNSRAGWDHGGQLSQVFVHLVSAPLLHFTVVLSACLGEGGEGGECV